VSVHLAIPGGALALIIAWHAARGKGGFGVIGGGGHEASADRDNFL